MSTRPPSQRQIRVLLVEDSPTQSLLIASILENYDRLDLLDALKDGEEALAYLRREGEYAGAKIPDMVLLDLHMPNKDGLEVLQEMKAAEDLKRIPVVMLTSSDRRDDVAKCYAAGASSYISKPVEPEELERVLKLVSDYWGLAAITHRQT